MDNEDVVLLIREGLPKDRDWEVLSGQEALDFLEREESKVKNDETEIPWWFWVISFIVPYLVVCWMKRHGR